MKVWICSNGSYSDVANTAVYSNKEDAETISKALGWNDPEEFELDGLPLPPEVRSGLRLFHVRIDADKDTRIPSVYQSDDIPEDCPDRIVARTWDDGGRDFMCCCWARDKEHALKIAADRLAQIKASPAQPAE